MNIKLTKEGKEDLAIALILLMDFKSEGKLDFAVSKTMYELADILGIQIEFEKMKSKIPPMIIKPR